MRSYETLSRRKFDFVRMDADWPGSTCCLERDGVSAWMEKALRIRNADLRWWTRHPDDSSLTIMSDVTIDGTWWWEWSPTEERWISSEELDR